MLVKTWFCSLYRIFHYIKCNMLSKSSKWELGFVHYIKKFPIPRFVISGFECIYLVIVNYHLLSTYIQFTYDKPCICLRSFNSIKCFFTITWAITTRSINQFCIVQRTFWIQSPEFICEKSCVYQIDSLSLKNTHLCPCGLAQGQI